MNAETSSAQVEWVLVPREPSAGMLDSAENAMIESEWAYNAGDPDARSDAHGFPTMRIWQAVVAYRAMLAAAQPPAAAEPKTLPVPTHVYLTDKAAVIIGDPQRGWDEDGPDAHNCDAMGCAAIGPHVLARVPFTDERAMSQPAEAQAQGGGEVRAWETEDGRVISARQKETALRDGGASASSVAIYSIPLYTAPPSAPVGVEWTDEAAHAFRKEVDSVGAHWHPWPVRFRAGMKAALATQHQEPTTCKHDFRRDEDHGGACCQLCGEVRQ